MGAGLAAKLLRGRDVGTVRQMRWRSCVLRVSNLWSPTQVR
jgi:hypothetical protein